MEFQIFIHFTIKFCESAINFLLLETEKIKHRVFFLRFSLVSLSSEILYLKESNQEKKEGHCSLLELCLSFQL